MMSIETTNIKWENFSQSYDLLITWSLSKHASLCRKSIAYGNSDAVCYVTIERLANNAVRVSKLICEEYEINMSPVNLKVEESSNGVYTLKSETSKIIEGMYNNNVITLTFGMRQITWSFTGKKE